MMNRFPLLSRAMAAVAILLVLAVLRYRPWAPGDASSASREKLTVGFLPVT